MSFFGKKKAQAVPQEQVPTIDPDVVMSKDIAEIKDFGNINKPAISEELIAEQEKDALPEPFIVTIVMRANTSYAVSAMFETYRGICTDFGKQNVIDFKVEKEEGN